MKKRSEEDERLVSRYVDGELSESARAEFEARMRADPLLREAVAAQRGVRDWFADVEHDPSGHDTPRASRDFADRVMSEARRLPPRQALLQELGVEGEVEARQRVELSTGRRLVIAAMLILSASLLFAAQLIRRTDARYLEAVDQRRIEEIDRRLELESRLREQAEPRQR